jgi:hypothetical protein
MRVQKQLYRHDLANGIMGDCHRTAIACVLDLDPQDVPHFMEGMPEHDASEAEIAAEKWLNARGLTQINVAFPGQLDVETILSTVANSNPRSKGIVYLLGGKSRNGTGHTVVCCDDKIACDPALDDAGIVGPFSDGMYWLTFFGSIAATHRPEQLVTKHRPDPELDHTLSVVSDAMNATGEAE